jgi:hypothetical protein
MQEASEDHRTPWREVVSVVVVDYELGMFSSSQKRVISAGGRSIPPVARMPVCRGSPREITAPPFCPAEFDSGQYQLAGSIIAEARGKDAQPPRPGRHHPAWRVDLARRRGAG